jgi:mannose-6-phosphate isomerase-like protein (cupin superfamily)
MERRDFIAALMAVQAYMLHAQQQPASGVPVYVAAGKDRFNKDRAIGVSSTSFKIATKDTNGGIFMMEQSNHVKGGPPRHLHDEQDEWWYVIEGEYIVEIGTDRFDLKPGDCAVGPRNVPHAWAFIGQPAGRLLVGFVPAGRMQEWFERDRKPGTYVNDAELYRSFGMELLGPPLTL